MRGAIAGFFHVFPMQFFLSVGAVGLLLISFFLGFIILLQRSSANAGMGTAFGAGAAEAAFGANTNKALTTATVWCTGLFFGLSLLLYLGNLHHYHAERGVKRNVNVESLVPAKDASKGALGDAKPLTPGATAVSPSVVVPMTPAAPAPAAPAAPVPPAPAPVVPAPAAPTQP